MTVKKNQFKKNTVKNKPAKVDKTENNDFDTVSTEKTKEKTKENSNNQELSSLIRFIKSPKTHRVFGLFLLVSSVFLTISFTSYLNTWKIDDNLFHDGLFSLVFDNGTIVANYMGRLGAVFAFLFIKKWFGIASYLFPFIFAIVGIRILFKTYIIPIKSSIKTSFFALLWISITIAYFFKAPDYTIYGGTFGYQANQWLDGLLGRFGTGILIFFSLMTFLIVSYNLSFNWNLSFLKRKGDETFDNQYLENELDNNNIDNTDENEELEEGSLDFEVIHKTNEPLTTEKIENQDKQSNKNNLSEVPFEISNTEVFENNENQNVSSTEQNGLSDLEKQEFDFINENGNVNNDGSLVDGQVVTAEDLLRELGEYDPKADLSTFINPKAELLDEYGSGTTTVQKEELEANKNKIVETLGNYSIQIDKIKATIGPTVTLYEIIPAPGIRISKIKNLEDDIALSLAALGIRIIAPIPGKGTIGIEVPNSKPEIVSMRSIFSSEKFINCNYELPIALGKTIANEIFIADLTKMPHLLMAGATGQGKSVGINAIIASILQKKHPSQVKFILIDPKKVELSLFSKIEKHFLAKLPGEDEAIITDTKKVVKTLNALCVEMDQRYELLKNAGVRQIREYNAKFVQRKLNPNKGHRYLPYIVLVVDEFADLMITAGKEVELPIARLAQLARAIGIHLIIATQRPSVNVITGTIKANFPARIAFKVSSKIDSRTILDSGGAEQLIGRGDMLVTAGSDLIRVQCAFVDTHEVERITDFIGSQRGYTSAMLLPEVADEEITVNGSETNADERDDMFEEAARTVVLSQQGSTSLLQRRLKLGFNRAGRIMDQLEKAGIVGPSEGSKPREVKFFDITSLEQYLKTLK